MSKHRRLKMSNKKYVYLFTEAHGLGKELLGGKGAGLVLSITMMVKKFLMKSSIKSRQS